MDENNSHNADSLIDKLNSLHSGLIDGNWRHLNRNAFVSVLEKNLKELKEIELGIKRVQLSFGNKSDAPESSRLLEEFSKTLALLDRNLELESNKSVQKPQFNWKEESEVPELYSSLEQKILALVLKCRYFAEKALLFEKKFKPIEAGLPSTSKALMDLLKQKENELEGLREKYENVRKKSFAGLISRNDAADLENELISSSRSLEANFTNAKKATEQLKKEFDSVQFNFLELKQKTDSLHSSLDSFVEKNLELTSVLKKERDYAKKVMLDVESETMQLRNQYTREILNLQEAKLIAKNESDEKHSGTIKALQKELAEKSDLIKNLHETASHQLKKLNELEEQNKKLKLLLNIKEKHEAVKKMFKGKK